MSASVKEGKKKQGQKRARFDEANLAENEAWLAATAPRMRIDEPKTPYHGARSGAAPPSSMVPTVVRFNLDEVDAEESPGNEGGENQIGDIDDAGMGLSPAHDMDCGSGRESSPGPAPLVRAASQCSDHSQQSFHSEGNASSDGVESVGARMAALHAALNAEDFASGSPGRRVAGSLERRGKTGPAAPCSAAPCSVGSGSVGSGSVGSGSDAEHEESAQFRAARRAHYNEFEMVKRLREQGRLDDDDDDDDDDEDGDGDAGGKGTEDGAAPT